MKAAIKGWYEGRYIPFQNAPDSSAVFINGGYYERHWTATATRWALSFYMREWKWVLGSLAAVIGAFVLKR
jgi:hypothetical protein